MASSNSLATKNHKASQLRLWVKTGLTATLPRMSLAGGRADQISAKTDFGARMSEAESRPDVPQAWPEGLGVAISSHSELAPRVRARIIDEGAAVEGAARRPISPRLRGVVENAVRVNFSN